jgi:glycerophosphoryl diester phosphodiesterase
MINRYGAALALLTLLCAAPLPATTLSAGGPQDVVMDDRPLRLVEALPEGDLKQSLQGCARGPFSKSAFSIGHRGAPLHFPEHTLESYLAAARQGAGRLECDAVMTRDGTLVCRHTECDLHTTTNILAVPELAASCREPFQPARFDTKNGRRLSPATARCCASDLSLEEFLSLRGKRDAENADATTLDSYMVDWRQDVDPAQQGGTLMTHRDSIRLFRQLGVGMVPELKEPENGLPKGVTPGDYARKLLAEYHAEDVAADQVWLQSFNLQDILFWIRHGEAFGRQAVFLDDRYRENGFDHRKPETWQPDMEELFGMGVRTIAPPLWVLLDLDEGNIVPSPYARSARAAGLDIVTWTLERSGSLEQGGGWYYHSIAPAITRDSDVLRVLDVLAQQVKVSGVFSDWPATVTYYANCTGLE